MAYRQLKITYTVSTYLYLELTQYIYRHTNIGQCLQNLLLITCNISEVKSAVTALLHCVYTRLLNEQVFLHFTTIRVLSPSHSSAQGTIGHC